MSYHNEGSGERSHTRPDLHLQPSPKPASLTYAVGAGSDPGKRKKRNEDSLFAARSTSTIPLSPWSCGLFVVADGLGAYADGQDASRGAIQAMVDWIWPRIVKGNALHLEVCSALLTHAVQLANEVVQQQNIDLRHRAGSDADDVGVLTTMAAAMIVGSTAHGANVGNCRTYLHRPGEGLKQITTDHSVVARLVQDGILTPEDVYTHPQRNQMCRSLGEKPVVEVDTFTIELQPGDVLLLCSDGLWDMVRDPKIEEVLSQRFHHPSQLAEMLIQAALDGGGKDNVSVIVVSMGEEQSQMFVPGVQLFARTDRLHIPPA